MLLVCTMLFKRLTFPLLRIKFWKEGITVDLNMNSCEVHGIYKVFLKCFTLHMASADNHNLFMVFLLKSFQCLFK